HYKDKIVTRGVLLDIARHKGVDALRPGEPIYIEDLESCAASQRVTVEPGDIVLVRTGDVGRRLRERSWGTFSAGDAPGLSFLTAPGLYDKPIAGLATRRLSPSPTAEERHGELRHRGRGLAAAGQLGPPAEVSARAGARADEGPQPRRPPFDVRRERALRDEHSHAGLEPSEARAPL